MVIDNKIRTCSKFSEKKFVLTSTAYKYKYTLYTLQFTHATGSMHASAIKCIFMCFEYWVHVSMFCSCGCVGNSCALH